MQLAQDTSVVITDLSDVLIGGMIGIGKIIEEAYDTNTHSTFSKCLAATKLDFFRLMRGQLDEQAYWSLVLSKGDWPKGFSVEVIMDLFSKNMKKKIPGTLYVYKNMYLPNKSRPIFYSLSDHIESRVGSLLEWHKDIFNIIDQCYWSFELGLIKQDPGFFKKFLEKTNLDKEKIIFIDDSKENIMLAKEAGIFSIQFKNSSQLKSDLEKCGFSFTPI